MDSLYSRYANALLSIAKEENSVKEYKNSLNALSNFFIEHDDVFTYLKSYFVKDEEKYHLIDEITKEFNLPNFSAFIKLLIKKHRLIYFKHITREFIKLANFELGIYDGLVYSTYKLSEEEIKDIELAISKKINNQVELENKIDESLIGGIKVYVNDHVYDGSIKSKLETLKNNLIERRN